MKTLVENLIADFELWASYFEFKDYNYFYSLESKAFDKFYKTDFLKFNKSHNIE